MKEFEFYPPLDIKSCFNHNINDEILKKYFGYTFKKSSEEEIKNCKQHLQENQHRLQKQQQQHFIMSNSSNNLKNDPNIRLARTPFPRHSPVPAKPIRKLGLIEKIFHGTNEKSRSYIYRTVIISSQINLYENLNIVNEAIQEWKNLHPLLRCRVIKTNSGEKQYKTTKENYFAFASEETQKSLQNIKYLYYKTPDPSNNKQNYSDDIWKLLLEKETTIPMDGENGLLWRLTFFKIESPKYPHTGGMHLYACILTFDHAIMDGRSSYNSLIQLFSIIERIYSSQSDYKRCEKSNVILPSKEEVFKNRVQNIENLNQNRYYLKAPKFLNINKDESNASLPQKYDKPKHLTNEDINKGVVYHHDHKPYTTVKELIEISKTNNSKFKALLITKKELDKILKKCKENQVKLTTYVNLAVSMAIRMIYEKYEQKQNQTINYTTNVSLREFIEYKNHAKNSKISESIGCYIGLSFSSFKEDLKYTDTDDDWVKDFWLLCKHETDQFHESLKKGDFIHSIHLPSKKKEYDEFFYHFGNSNLGVLKSEASNTKLIKVRQAFATGRYSKENFLCWFTNLLSTIDNQLCWTISYNSNMIKEEIIDEIVQNLTKIIRAISK